MAAGLSDQVSTGKQNHSTCCVWPAVDGQKQIQIGSSLWFFTPHSTLQPFTGYKAAYRIAWTEPHRAHRLQMVKHIIIGQRVLWRSNLTGYVKHLHKAPHRALRQHDGPVHRTTGQYAAAHRNGCYRIHFTESIGRFTGFEPSGALTWIGGWLNYVIPEALIKLTGGHCKSPVCSGSYGSYYAWRQQLDLNW